MRYHVVYEYMSTAGSSAGLRYRVGFEDEAAFRENDHSVGPDAEVHIVARGVSDAESLRLCEMVPMQKHVRAAIANSKMSDGRVDGEVLALELGQLAFAKIGKDT